MTSNSVEMMRVLDERAIKAVLLRYCRGVDRLDERLIQSVYHDGATDDHGVYKGDAHGFAAFIVPLLRATYISTMHAIHNCSIEFDDVGAGVETYCVAYHSRVDEAGQPWLDVFGCRYVDRFESRDGVWAITERIVVHDWNVVHQVSHDFGEMVSSFSPGRRGADDVGYSVLGRS